MGQGDIQDMEKSVGFGISFIVTLFLSGLSGYFLASEVFQLTKTQSYMLAGFFLITTLFLEMILFITRSQKNDLKAKQHTQ